MWTHLLGIGVLKQKQERSLFFQVFIHSAGPSTPRATTPKSPRTDDRIRIYVPYESPHLSPKKSPKKTPPRHQNSHDSDATIMNSNGGNLNGVASSLPNSYSSSYIPPQSPTRHKYDSHRSVSNPTSIYEQYETNKITIHIVDENLATPLNERIPNSPFHMDNSNMIHMDLKWRHRSHGSVLPNVMCCELVRTIPYFSTFLSWKLSFACAELVDTSMKIPPELTSYDQLFSLM